MGVSVVPDDVAAFLGKGNVERFVKAEERLRGCSANHSLDDDDWPGSPMVASLNKRLRECAPCVPDWPAVLPCVACCAALHTNCDATLAAMVCDALCRGQAELMHRALPVLLRAARHALPLPGAIGPHACLSLAALCSLLRRAAGAGHAELSRDVTAALATHLESSQGGASSEGCLRLLLELLAAGVASPEALAKLVLLAALELGQAQADAPPPPLLARYAAALAQRHGPPLLCSHLLTLCLAPLERPGCDARWAVMAGSLRHTLAPCCTPNGAASPPPSLRPPHTYLPPPPAAFSLRALIYAPSGTDTGELDALVERLATGARRQSPASSSSSSSTRLIIAAALAPPGGASRRAEPLLAALLARQRSDEGSDGDCDDAQAHRGDDAAWQLCADALVDAAVRDGSVAGDALLADSAQEAPGAAVHGEALAAAARVSLGACSTPACAALLGCVGWHAGGYARSGSPRQLRRCAALLAALRRAAACVTQAGRPLSACLLEACARLESAVRAGEARCAPCARPPLGLVPAVFAATCRQAPRLWPAFLPLVWDARAGVQAWAAAPPRAATEAHAQLAAALRAVDALPAHSCSCAELLLHAATSASEEELAGAEGAPSFTRLCGTGPEATRLLAWLLLQLHSRTAADAGMLCVPAPGRLSRLRELLDCSDRLTEAPDAPALLRHALALAARALRVAVADWEEDVQWARGEEAQAMMALHRDDVTPEEASLGAQTPRKRRRGEEAEAEQGTFLLQTAPLEALLGCDAGDVAAQIARGLTQPGDAAARAAALHCAARALCCGASPLARALQQLLLGTEAATHTTLETRAARQLSLRMRERQTREQLLG